jgi:hypothetical protein
MQWEPFITRRRKQHIGHVFCIFFAWNKIMSRGSWKLIELLWVSCKSAYWKPQFTFVRAFHIEGRILLKFGVRDLRVMLLNVCEFRQYVGKALLYGLTWNYIYTCTAKLYGIFKAKNALVKSGFTRQTHTPEWLFFILFVRIITLFGTSVVAMWTCMHGTLLMVLQCDASLWNLGLSKASCDT